MSGTSSRLRKFPDQREGRAAAPTLIDIERAWTSVPPPRADGSPLCGTHSATSILDDQRRPLAMAARRDFGRAEIVPRRGAHVRVDRYAAKRREAPQATGSEKH